MTAWQKWLTALIGVTAAVIVSYLWIDRPLALFVHGQFEHNTRLVAEPLTHIPDPLIPLAVAGFVGFGLWALAGRPLARLPAVFVVSSLSVIMGEALKNELKFVFGRSWPETWYHNNPSFIRDGVYGFHWFHGGTAYASFPSGHMTAICAVIGVLWIYYPRLKPLWALAALLVAVGLIGADFHFLSDVIAGGFVGTSCAWMTTALVERLRASLARRFSP